MSRLFRRTYSEGKNIDIRPFALPVNQAKNRPMA